MKFLRSEQLKNLLHKKELNNTDKLLVLLAAESIKAKSVKEIRLLGHNAGLREIKNWNVSALLKKTGGRAVRTSQGWELTEEGKTYLLQTYPFLEGGRPQLISDLMTHLKGIKNPDVLAFLREAISCHENGNFRAAVVLSWVGAVAVLYDIVVGKHLVNFNKAAKARNPKWRDAVDSDGLARMKESDFLDILESISVLGKSVKDDLKDRLKLRNGCGHPNSFKISKNMVAAHIESLTLNVFKRSP